MSDGWSIVPPGDSQFKTSVSPEKWQMDMFGDGSVIVRFFKKPSILRRITCTILFGTKWKSFR